MQSSSWMASNNSNNSNFWSNGGFRKRKAGASDLDEQTNQKIFVTEEKMVKEMQTLSLDLAALNNNNIPNSSPEPIIEEISSPKIEEADSSDDEKDKNYKEKRFELHKLLRERLKDDDLQDNLIAKLCENERRRYTMQIVPYMPIHPSQLNKDKPTTDDKTKDEDVDEGSVTSGKHLFKIPSVPTAYTVEEPCDSTIKRPSAMKRSYSQSNEYNSNLSVTELKHDGNDSSSMTHSQSTYFIVEPSAIPLSQMSSTTSSSSLSSNGPSIRITEFIDNPITNNEFTSTVDDDDDIDMQSVASSDTGDKMDDD